jgi:hypothetical protein
VREAIVRYGGASVARRPLGDTGDWYRVYARPDEAYLWRARLVMAELRDPSDALAVLAAFGRAQNLDLNVQGICVKQMDAGTQVDVVLTTPTTQIYTPLVDDDAESLAIGVMSDASLRQRFPSLAVRSPELLQITGPPDAIDFWRSHATVWDPSLGQTGHGGPTQAFANLSGAYLGAADEGPRLKPWKVDRPGLEPDQDNKTDATVFWVIGGIALAWLVVRSIGAGAN